MSDDILKEQIAYYRARAQEYDESVYQTGRFASSHKEGASFGSNFDFAARLLQRMGPFEEIVELACGTGIWTGDLAQIGKAVTALDASPEMLEINRRKVADARVRYEQADLFAWEPARQYDLVFFAFWLSHVPPESLDAFLARVRRATRPGGQLFIVDQYAPVPGKEWVAAQQGIYHRRALYDGRAFTMVKVFYDTALLEEKLGRLGFQTQTQKSGECFFALTGTLG
jgi:demethylmenaquinone methyltransferase/2-methoxy-6-polyprenyl-1,4-benzoquinol methylase